MLCSAAKTSRQSGTGTTAAVHWTSSPKPLALEQVDCWFSCVVVEHKTTALPRHESKNHTYPSYHRKSTVNSGSLSPKHGHSSNGINLLQLMEAGWHQHLPLSKYFFFLLLSFFRFCATYRCCFFSSRRVVVGFEVSDFCRYTAVPRNGPKRNEYSLAGPSKEWVV